MTFRNGSYQSGSSGTAVGTEPSGAAQGDALFALVTLEGGTPTWTDVSATWTLLKAWTFSASWEARLYTCRRGSSAPTYSFGSGSGFWEVGCAAFSGVSSIGRIVATNAYAEGTSLNPPNPNPPSIENDIAGADILIGGMGWTGWYTTQPTAPSGYTRCYSPYVSDGGQDNIMAYLNTSSTTGTIDPGAFSGQGGTANDWFSFTLALYPTEVVSDNFDRTNASTLGANWTKALSAGTDWSIVSNQAQHNTVANDALEYHNSGASVGDQWSEITITDVTDGVAWSASCGPGIAVRVTSTSGGNGYFGMIDASNIRLGRIAAGSANYGLATAAYTAADGDVIRISAVGTAIRVYANGVLMLNYTDDIGLNTGYPGVWGSGDGQGQHALLDNWKAGYATSILVPKMTLLGVG
jgi:hypothetical protein